MKFTRTKMLAALLLTLPMALGTTATYAETIKLRIASGHPPGVVYAGLMKDFFQVELKKQIEAKTKHKVEWTEGYSGSIVKVTETFEGVQNGIIDIGGFCFCFEASKLPLHAFQVMLPFGTMDPTVSLKVAQDVYKAVPYLTEVFEKKYNQKLLARIADGGYNLGTSFEWNKVADLKGVKIAGAGLNLNWLKYAGVTPVQGSLPEAYTGMKTHVYEGWIMFPSAWVNLKLYEPGPHYTLIGFGSITWHGLTMNKKKFDSLPKDVKPIVLEVAKAFEELTGSNNKERYSSDIAKLKGGLAKVKELDPAVRKEWALSLKDWPQSHADTLKKDGLPVVKALNTALESAEKHGHTWPVRYTVK
ncbi:MAG: C4-dicarboxylate TRAP transporter substrate-binding protein [Betaproteobacteria bacterium]|nr:C4-dicarboxylate TRAP transporter substrate-binding protein [Betaproteobacteria bacterium]